MIELLGGKGDLGAAGVTVSLLELHGLLLDDVELLGLAREDLLAAGDELLEVVVLGLELGLLESGELAETHLDDGGGLSLGESEGRHEFGLGLVDIGGTAYDGDDLVDDVDGPEQAFEDMGALLCLLEVEPGAAHHDLVTEVYEIGDDLLERKGTGTALDQRHVVDGEAGLEGGVLEERVHHDVGIGILLQVEDDADALAAGKLLDVRDAVDALVLDHLADALDHLALVHHVRHLGDDDAVAAALVLLDLGARTDDDLAASSGVCVDDALASLDDASGREVRTLDVLHETLDGDVGVVDVRANGVAALGEVVRSHVGGHTDGDAGRSVKEQEGRLGREHGGLRNGIVEVELEVNRILVEVRKHVLGDPFELCLGVTHGCDGVAVHGSEIALSEDEGITLVPVLGKSRHGVIDAGVAVGVELAQHLTDNPGGFLGLSGIVQAEAVHSEKHAPLHGLESVPDIGEGAGHDDGHRIVDVRGTHLVVDLDRFNDPVKLLVGIFLNIHKSALIFL